MSELNIEELKAAALAATCGPWESKHHGVFKDSTRICDMSGTRGKYEWEQGNRDFIALANPDTVLALLERLQVVEDVVKRSPMGAVWPLKESTCEKVLNTILWFYHRAKPTYGTLPFAEEAIALLNAPQPTDINDTKRLDFMLANPSYNLVFFDLGQEWCVCSDYGGWSISSGKTQREAIDNAITIAAKEPTP